jgi:hypothetical protein
MDPYLEGHLWPDVHSALASKIRQFLAPRVRPTYVVRLAVYLVEDLAPEGEVGILYPDVEVLRSTQPPALAEIRADYKAVSTPPLLLPVLPIVDVRITSVEIRDAAGNRLVTSIEILSPVNKREPGLAAYRKKRRQLLQAGVHLVEIDLLRRGERPVSSPQLSAADYVMAVTRAGARYMEAWPLALADRLPVLPIPLQPPDGDAALDMQAALQAVYDEASYDLSIDYGQPPPPPALAAEQQAWLRALMAGR